MYQSIASSTLCQSICCYWVTPFYLQSPSSTPLWLTPVNPYFAQENDLTVNLQEKIEMILKIFFTFERQNLGAYWRVKIISGLEYQLGDGELRYQRPTQIDKYVTQFVCRGHILKDCQKIRRKNVEKLKLTANSSLTVFSQRGKHDLS